MATVYSTLAAEGVRHDPVFVTKVLDRNGDVIFDRAPRAKRVLDAEIARTETDILTGVIKNGTGTRANIGRPAAGKTGTTDDFKDNWFVGFTPDILSFGVNYIRSRFSLRLTGAYQAETRKSYIQVVPGTSNEGFIPPRTYEYQAAATQYGVSAEYALAKRLSLYLNWSNVFAEDRRISRRASSATTRS